MAPRGTPHATRNRTQNRPKESVGQEPLNEACGADLAREFFNPLQKFMQQQTPPSIVPVPQPSLGINEFVEQFRRMMPPNLTERKDTWKHKNQSPDFHSETGFCSN